MTRPTRTRALAVAVALWLSSGVATGQPAELIIRGGTIVTVEGTTQSDIRVRDGIIVEIGDGLAATGGAREVDADGLLVLPGGIDPHVHLGLDFSAGWAILRLV